MVLLSIHVTDGKLPAQRSYRSRRLAVTSGITLKFGARMSASNWRRKRHQLRNAHQCSTVYLYCNIKHSRSGQSPHSYVKSDIWTAVGNGLPGGTQPRFASDALVEWNRYQIQIGLVASSSDPHGFHDAFFASGTIIGSAFLIIGQLIRPPWVPQCLAFLHQCHHRICVSLNYAHCTSQRLGAERSSRLTTCLHQPPITRPDHDADTYEAR